VVGFVQARMTSSRLRGKALMNVVGRPVTAWIIERLYAARELDEVVLCITTQKEDDALEALAKEMKVPVYRGENEHLIEAYFDIANTWNADAVVCITGDCPFVDPKLIDELVRVYRNAPDAYDLITNVLPSMWPDGLDIFVYPKTLLAQFYEERKTLPYTYPVTFNFSKESARYRIYNLENADDLSHLRWTLDYEEDLEFVRRVYAMLLPRSPLFTTKDILQLLREQPKLAEINAHRGDPSHGWGDNIKAFKKSGA